MATSISALFVSINVVFLFVFKFTNLLKEIEGKFVIFSKTEFFFEFPWYTLKNSYYQKAKTIYES